MESRWSSSGKYSQDSRRWTSSKRFKNFFQTYSVNLSSSTTGSSSCQCRTTWYGESKETRKKCENNSGTVANYVRRFPRGRWSFLGPGSEKKWYGTYSDKHNRDCGLTLQKAVIQYFVPPAPWKEENQEAKKKERSLFISTVAKKTLN